MGKVPVYFFKGDRADEYDPLLWTDKQGASSFTGWIALRFSDRTGGDPSRFRHRSIHHYA
jgi:hypothetical protein